MSKIRKNKDVQQISIALKTSFLGGGSANKTQTSLRKKSNNFFPFKSLKQIHQTHQIVYCVKNIICALDI